MFQSSALTEIHIPASVEVICERCFFACRLLRSVTFAPGCQLSRLEKSAFHLSGLTRIHIPASVEVISEQCFFKCYSLRSITFDPNSRLQGRESDLLAGIAVKNRSLCYVC
jgi:hypothetical protein